MQEICSDKKRNVQDQVGEPERHFDLSAAQDFSKHHAETGDPAGYDVIRFKKDIDRQSKNERSGKDPYSIPKKTHGRRHMSVGRALLFRGVSSDDMLFFRRTVVFHVSLCSLQIRISCDMIFISPAPRPDNYCQKEGILCLCRIRP